MDFSIDKLDELLGQLKTLPKIKEVTALLQRLEKEKEKLSAPEPIPAISREERIKLRNQKIAQSQKKHHRFIRLIFDNLNGKITYRKIQAEFKKRRQGQHSEISDAIWFNPSA